MQTTFLLTKLLWEMRPGVLPMTQKQSDRDLNGLVRHPLAEQTEIPKDPHQNHVDNFFNSRGMVHKEFIPEGRTVNAEFYKGVRDRRVHPAAICSQDFFLLHDNAPTQKAVIVCQFLTQKILQPFYHPPHSPDLSPPDYFLFLKLKMKLKGLHFADVAEIQEAITDELKKGPKRGIFGSFLESV